jgi:hypothetical protein
MTDSREELVPTKSHRAGAPGKMHYTMTRCKRTIYFEVCSHGNMHKNNLPVQVLKHFSENFVTETWMDRILVQHAPCRPLFLSRGMPIPSGLSDFPVANSCGNGTYVFEISLMRVSRLENCNKWRIECGVFEEAESYFYTILLSLLEKRFRCESLLPSRSESVLINNPA